VRRVPSSIVSQLGGQAAFLLIGNVFTLLVGFPLQIYVARMLGADGLGVFSLIEGGVGLAAGLVAFGQAPTLVRFIPAYLERGQYAGIRRLVRRGAVILLVAGGLMYGLGLLALPVVVRYWPSLGSHKADVAVMGLLIPLSLIVYFLQQGLRGFQETRYLMLGSSVVQLTVKAFVAVLLLAAGFQLTGYVWAVVISVITAVGWMAVGLRRKLGQLPLRSNREIPREDAKAWRDYARVMYTGSLLGMGCTYLDRLLLAIFAGPSLVGILSVLKQLQQMPVVFLQMLLAVTAPMFSAAHAKDSMAETQHIYHLAIDWVIRLSAPLFIFVFLFAEQVLNLYGGTFASDGLYSLWILLASQVINLALGPAGQLMWMSGLEKQALQLTSLQAAVATVGLITLVPKFGLVGAASAFCASVVFINIAELFVAKRRIHLRWWDVRYLRWTLPAFMAIVAGIGLKLHGPTSPGLLLLGGDLLVLYVIFHGVTLVQGLHEDDRALLGHLRARWSALTAKSTPDSQKS
jgi:O-antigen/teichoic acid export membrane protein